MGSVIARCYPLGATDPVLTLTCAYALWRTARRHGLAAMSIGRGQGIVLDLESA